MTTSTSTSIVPRLENSMTMMSPLTRGKMRRLRSSQNRSRRSAALPEKEEHLKTLHRLEKDQQKHSQDLSELKADVKKLHSLLLKYSPRHVETSALIMNVCENMCKHTWVHCKFFSVQFLFVFIDTAIDIK